MTARKAKLPNNVPAEMSDDDWKEVFRIRELAMTILRERGRTQWPGAPIELTGVEHHGLKIVFSPRQRPIMWRGERGVIHSDVTPPDSKPRLTIHVQGRCVLTLDTWDADAPGPDFALHDYQPGEWQALLRAETPALAH